MIDENKLNKIRQSIFQIFDKLDLDFAQQLEILADSILFAHLKEFPMQINRHEFHSKLRLHLLAFFQAAQKDPLINKEKGCKYD